jgi:hypothetical protein
MAASTITRTTWTNDTGTVSSPNNDGTIINNARLQDIYAAIDQLFSGAGSYTTLTFGGLVAAEGFGTHNFSGGGTGAHTLKIRNTTAGTGNYGKLSVGSNTDDLAQVLALSSSFTSAGMDFQSGVSFKSIGSGGLHIGATHASGAISFYTGGTTSRGFFTAAGTLILNHQLQVADGGTPGAPGICFQSDPDTGLFRATTDQINIALGGNTEIVLQPRSASAGPNVSVMGAAFGTGSVAGAGLIIGKNTSGGGAASWIRLSMRSSGDRYLWVDDTGDLRIGTAPPTENNSTVSDTSGTVIGTQT